jgi:hypothetical protein
MKTGKRIGSRSMCFILWLIAIGSQAHSRSFASDPIVDIRSSELTESSGLAVSRREASCFWTHNDSGGEPKLFAVNIDGKVTGSIFVTDCVAIDWEDIATFGDAEQPWIVVADIGDNVAKRTSVTLSFLREPDPRQHHRQTAAYRLEVNYPDGARDCEAIAIDTKHREIVFVAKSFLPTAQVYTIPLPDLSNADSVKSSKAVLQYRGTLAIPLISAMDIDAESGDILLVNYFQCFWFQRDAAAAKDAWLTQVPEVTDLPKLKQIEAVAITPNRDVWVTSEGNPAKLTKVRSLKTALQESFNRQP